MIPYQKRWPTPEQIQTWLKAHGWTPDSSPPADPEDGLDFTHWEPADDGSPIWVRAPQVVFELPEYGLCVASLVTTAAWMEDRPELDVFHEMLAVEPARPAMPPPAPSAALAQSPAVPQTSD